MIWIAISLVMGIVILLIDDRYSHILAYPIWFMSIALLLSVALFGKEVNGARSWIEIGPFAIQPTEFVKFSTALALARLMSDFDFSLKKGFSLIQLAVIIGVPMLIIFLQNDMGSALVYFAFAFMLYREGLNGWIYIVAILAIALFVSAFLITPMTLLITLGLLSLFILGLNDGRWRDKITFLSIVSLSAIVLYFFCYMLLKIEISSYTALLICSIAGAIYLLISAIRRKIALMFMLAAMFLGSLTFASTVDYIFDNYLQIHQQKRILDLLGLEQDLKGWGYNVNQSKIAIGSGGITGKGFLNGTQTRYNFVPEQSTDFIFCTIGEEWGFVGSLTVVLLFMFLIMKLMRMGERQSEAFGRIYCYSVASIFFMHVIINIGMTIGIVPVIGIPLPFFSYGGSSLLAFSVMFLVAVKMDAKQREVLVF